MLGDGNGGSPADVLFGVDSRGDGLEPSGGTPGLGVEGPITI